MYITVNMKLLKTAFNTQSKVLMKLKLAVPQYLLAFVSSCTTFMHETYMHTVWY